MSNYKPGVNNNFFYPEPDNCINMLCIHGFMFVGICFDVKECGLKALYSAGGVLRIP